MKACKTHRVALWAAVSAATLAGCAKTYRVNMSVHDGANRPLEAAVVYLEVYTYGGAGTFDFLALKTDASGQAGPRDWRVRSHGDNKVAMVAFAKGKVPQLRNPKVPNFFANVRFRLLDPQQSRLPYAQVSKLAFPFPEQSQLRQRVSHPRYRWLWQAFLDGYLLMERAGAPYDRTKRDTIERWLAQQRHGPEASTESLDGS
jgi:hypothetical protein